MPRCKSLSDKEKEELLRKIQKDLPKKWIVRFSTKHESRVYFFNKTTGERSWKFPSKTKEVSKRKHGIEDTRKPPDPNNNEKNEEKIPRDKPLSCSTSREPLLKIPRKNKGIKFAVADRSVEKYEKTKKQKFNAKNALNSAKRKSKSEKHDKASIDTVRIQTQVKNSKKSHHSFSTSSAVTDIEMLDLTYPVNHPKSEDEKIPNIFVQQVKCELTLFAIVDTNFLFESYALNEIHILLQNSLNHAKFKGIQFIIPWVVIQELDKLKQNKTEARTAISFLNSHFRRYPKAIRGQTIFEAATVIDGLQIESNDDRVLQCCFLMQRASGLSILLTKDMNLMNKSIVNAFKCFKDINCFLSFLNGNDSEIMEPAEREESNTSSLVVVTKSSGSPNGTTVLNENNIPSCKTKNGGTSHRFALEDILNESQTIFLSSLAYILEKEMKKAFEDLWLDVVLRKPPWRLKDVFLCINKHWLAVFKLMGVDRLVQYNLTNLIQMNRTRILESSLNQDNLMEWLLSGQNLILGIQQKGKYDNPVKEDLITLRNLIEKLKSIRNDTKTMLEPVQWKDANGEVQSSPEKMTSVEFTEDDQEKSSSSLHQATDPAELTCNFWTTLDKIWSTILFHCAIIFKTLHFTSAHLETVPEIVCLMKEPCDIPERSIADYAVPLVIDVVKSIGLCLENLTSLCEKKDPACESVFVDLLHALWTAVQAFAVDCDLECLITDNLRICRTIAHSSEMIERIKSGYNQLGLVLKLLCECQEMLQNSCS